MPIEELHGVRVDLLDVDGPTIATDDDTSDLIGGAWSSRAALIAIPVERLDERFFDLSSGFAGEVLGKLGKYRLRIAIIGDVSEHIAANDAFDAFVWETNRGDAAWFVPDAEALAAKLADRARR
ncbi:hypothetical protein ASE14_00410 [Agromyces sp. Root81]|uniref:DUF4180 domain-containing protein n=1 Tax=Agromyces sp. Root81 TaxID=1736601 RepID=UPI0007012979|nr:DUF4180 domain-containing protein [Agromyces sp. Root81]KRC62349.1 hypothetical protein ASE14_00410 [Agromyces sp. Root81]